MINRETSLKKHHVVFFLILGNTSGNIIDRNHN